MCRAVPRAIVGEAVRGRGWAVVGVAVCAGVDGVGIGGEVGVVVPMGMVAVGMAGVVFVVVFVVVGVVVGVVRDVGVVVVTAERKEPYRQECPDKFPPHRKPQNTVKHKLALCWPRSCPYVWPILLRWPYVGLSWPYLAPVVDPSIACPYVSPSWLLWFGPMLPYVGRSPAPMFDLFCYVDPILA